MKKNPKIDPIDAAQLALRDAVASGNAKKIDAAAARLEDARAAEARKVTRSKDLAAAQGDVNRQRIVKAQADRLARANKAEDDLRAVGEPYVEVHMGDGHIVLIDLSSTEVVKRSTALEAVRRTIIAAANGFADRLAASRNLGAVVSAKDITTPLLDHSAAGLYYANQHGTVGVKSETHA